MDKRGKNRKSDRVTMLAVAGYVLFLVIGFPAAEKEGGFYPALLILAEGRLSVGGGERGEGLSWPRCGFKGWVRETAPGEE